MRCVSGYACADPGGDGDSFGSGISAPAELPAGPATVTNSNHRQAPRLLLFARLNAEVMSEQFMAALTTDRTGGAALALTSTWVAGR
ncbi:MAG: hypothetical protein BroJett021_50440 [Chloroflexota bacterium]|nr:hypothetical protein [Caldilinea sp.]GIK76056.1 MAG: hypothetical protein BroJett021_50440 [Chloroflexota bacterium]